METVGEFLIAEREFSDDESKLSIGLANIHAEVPGIEANKDKILRAANLLLDARGTLNPPCRACTEAALSTSRLRLHKRKSGCLRKDGGLPSAGSRRA